TQDPRPNHVPGPTPRPGALPEPGRSQDPRLNHFRGQTRDSGPSPEPGPSLAARPSLVPGPTIGHLAIFIRHEEPGPTATWPAVLGHGRGPPAPRVRHLPSRPDQYRRSPLTPEAE